MSGKHQDEEFLDEDMQDTQDSSPSAGEFSEEEWDEFSDEGEDGFDEEPSPEKTAAAQKKKSHFNNIVIAVTVVIGLGVMVMQMGSGPSTAPVQPPQQNAQNDIPQPVAMEQAKGNNQQLPLARDVNNTDYSARDVIYGRATSDKLPPKPGETGKDDGSKPKTGLMNDPSLVRQVEGKTRENEFDSTYFLNEEGGADGAPDVPVRDGSDPASAPKGRKPQLAEDNPPMPAPIVSGETDALTPMTFDDLPADGAAENVVAAGDVPRGPEDPDAPASAGLPKAGEIMIGDAAGGAESSTASLPDQANAPQEEGFVDPFAQLDVNAPEEEEQTTEITPAGNMAVDSGSQTVSAATPSGDAAGDAVLAALDARMGQIFDRLDQIEKRMQENTGDASGGGDVKQLADALEKLEKRLDDIDGKPKQQRAALSVGTIKKADTEDDSAPVPRKTTQVRPAARKAVSSASAPVWTLKAAQPGRAMVANAGTGETYNVAVGDTLAGIGEIVGVSYENGRWVVHGSQGRIVQ